MLQFERSAKVATHMAPSSSPHTCIGSQPTHTVCTVHGSSPHILYAQYMGPAHTYCMHSTWVQPTHTVCTVHGSSPHILYAQYMGPAHTYCMHSTWVQPTHTVCTVHVLNYVCTVSYVHTACTVVEGSEQCLCVHIYVYNDTRFLSKTQLIMINQSNAGRFDPKVFDPVCS